MCFGTLNLQFCSNPLAIRAFLPVRERPDPVNHQFSNDSHSMNSSLSNHRHMHKRGRIYLTGETILAVESQSMYVAFQSSAQFQCLLSTESPNFSAVQLKDNDPVIQVLFHLNLHAGFLC